MGIAERKDPNMKDEMTEESQTVTQWTAVVISRERPVVRRHFSSLTSFQSRVAHRNLP